MAKITAKQLLSNFKAITDMVNDPSNKEEHLKVTRKLPDAEWRKAVINPFIDYLKQEEPALFEKTEEHYGQKLDKLILSGFVRPFSVVKVMAEQVTPEKFLNTLLAHKKEDKIVIDFCEPSEFVDKIKAMNEAFFAASAEAPKPVFEAKELPKITGKDKTILDSVLQGMKWPTTDAIADVYGNQGIAKAEIEKLLQEIVKAQEETELVRQELSKASIISHAPIVIEPVSTEIPKGKTIRKKVSELFPEIKFDSDFEVTCFEWDGPHPMVPAVNKTYIFRKDLVLKTLFALEANQRGYLQGHTGTGKTTLLEQVAARLNYPVMRVNFDSEITRMDLIGRDTLKDGESVFIEGLLPQMMAQPCIGIFDEIDFCRPDVAYVMQSALENNSLRITEDGGREVKPHPMFRMFGTGNTVGQGDEEGMYQGARPQSLAFLDRFTVWMKVDYLENAERINLIKKVYPAIAKKDAETIGKYVTEHLAAFKEQGKVIQPMSPRGMLAIAHAALFYNSIGDKNHLRSAFTQVVLDRANKDDYPTLVGIVDRVLKN